MNKNERKTKYYVMSIQDTNQFVKNIDNETKLLIITLGQTLTKLPEIRQNIVELNVMFADVYGNKDHVEKVYGKDLLTNVKLHLIEATFATRKQFDHVIIRCDAGASRSQALATALHRTYGVNFENNILVGNLDLLQVFEKYFGVNRTQEGYEKLFNERKDRTEKLFKRMGEYE